MNPPSSYFKRCSQSEPGAQRIGSEWFCFHDSDCLSLWLSEMESNSPHRTLFSTADFTGYEEE